MAEYKVTQVSSQPPKEYDGQNGKIFYIKVALQGHPKPVSIGKKTPNALKAGDTVHGNIMPTQYDTDNFKAENKPYQAGSGSPKDQDAIRAQWAIGQAVQISVHYETSYDVIKVENNAKDLFAMVDRVKGSSIELNTVAPAAQLIPKQQPQTFTDGSPVPDPVDDGFDIDAPISLNDIPF